MIYKIIYYFIIAIIIIGCKESADDISVSVDDLKINTVISSIPCSDMGITLIHEHFLVDFIGAEQTGFHRWDREKVIEKVLPYLNGLKKYNVNTIFECTPAFLGRDINILRELSER